MSGMERGQENKETTRDFQQISDKRSKKNKRKIEQFDDGGLGVWKAAIVMVVAVVAVVSLTRALPCLNNRHYDGKLQR